MMNERRCTVTCVRPQVEGFWHLLGLPACAGQEPLETKQVREVWQPYAWECEKGARLSVRLGSGRGGTLWGRSATWP